MCCFACMNVCVIVRECMLDNALFSNIICRRLQVNLKQLLNESTLEPADLFECLCERDRVRLWPWLHTAQLAALQELLLSRPQLPKARLAFDSVTRRHKALARCARFELPIRRDLHCEILCSRMSDTSRRVNAHFAYRWPTTSNSSHVAF